MATVAQRLAALEAEVAELRSGRPCARCSSDTIADRGLSPAAGESVLGAQAAAREAARRGTSSSYGRPRRRIMSPRGRHEFTGRHEAGYQPADEPWARSSQRGVWRAYRGCLVLTATELVGGGWEAEVEGPAPGPVRRARDPPGCPSWADRRPRTGGGTRDRRSARHAGAAASRGRRHRHSPFCSGQRLPPTWLRGRHATR